MNVVVLGAMSAGKSTAIGHLVCRLGARADRRRLSELEQLAEGRYGRPAVSGVRMGHGTDRDGISIETDL